MLTCFNEVILATKFLSKLTLIFLESKSTSYLFRGSIILRIKECFPCLQERMDKHAMFPYTSFKIEYFWVSLKDPCDLLCS